MYDEKWKKEEFMIFSSFVSIGPVDTICPTTTKKKHLHSFHLRFLFTKWSVSRHDVCLFFVVVVDPFMAGYDGIFHLNYDGIGGFISIIKYDI